MRFSKAALEAEGWRARAPEPVPVVEVEKEPEGPEEPSLAETLKPLFAELAAALKSKPQPVVVTQESKAQPVKGIKVHRNKDGLIDRFELIY